MHVLPRSDSGSVSYYLISYTTASFSMYTSVRRTVHNPAYCSVATLLASSDMFKQAA